MGFLLMCGWMVGLAYVWWGGDILASDLEAKILEGTCDADDAVRQLAIQSAIGLLLPPLVLLLFAGGAGFLALVAMLANGIVFAMVTLPRITALYETRRG
jgi:hypothetical protein